MILVIGHVRIAAGALDAALALSRAHVQRSRTEPGCMSHAVHQDADDALHLVFVEQWADATALRTHFGRADARGFVAALAPLAAAPPSIQIYQAEPVRV
jgi:quinol monooxygenase YgiN